MALGAFRYTTAMQPILIVQRGLESYDHTYRAMREFTQSRDVSSPDQLWLVTHPPIFTLGLGADPGNILDAHHIPVVQTDRGGEVTFHGPGQAIVYLLIDLRRRHIDGKLLPREFVHLIEQAIIDTLAAYNLVGQRKAGAPGIYLASGPYSGAKIAALGLKVRVNGCTYHGLSLNVAMDLTPFSWIHPCGYEDLVTVDMQSLGVDVDVETVQAALANNLIHQLKG